MYNNNKKHPIGCFLIIDFLLDVNVCKGKINKNITVFVNESVTLNVIVIVS